MPLVHFLPDAIEIEAREGETLLSAALRAGLPLAHICGGRARCSTCRVIILEGHNNLHPPNAKERAIAAQLNFPPGVRLACQAVPLGPVKLRRLVLDDEDLEMSSLFIKGVTPGLAGVEKQIFIMFADIIGFTSFAEELLPYDVIHVLNRCFHRLGEVIARHGGHIDSYMGDGLMALFEAEEPAAGALRAIRAGLEMLRAVRALGPYLTELFQRSFEIRLGLHYGQVVAGTLGAPGTKKLTVIGDAVNLASRIEAANKRAGTQFLISADVYSLVKNKIQVGHMAHLTLPGKTGKYRLYEVVGLK